MVFLVAIGLLSAHVTNLKYLFITYYIPTMYLGSLHFPWLVFGALKNKLIASKNPPPSSLIVNADQESFLWK